MAIREILLLGNPKLYEVSLPLEKHELDTIAGLVEDLHDTLLDFRSRYGAGRAIAAPQIGVMQRLIYMHIDRPVAFINPVLDAKSEAMIEVWDDCMCFPDLLVKVRRHRSCRMRFKDGNWIDQEIRLEDDLSELLQHEHDHLDGTLAVSRALDGESFALRSQRPQSPGPVIRPPA
ncbi:MAG: peptide deformylase [Nitrospirota bacterium]